MAGSFFWRRTDDLSEIEKAVIGDTVPTEAIEVRVYIYRYIHDQECCKEVKGITSAPILKE